MYYDCVYERNRLFGKYGFNEAGNGDTNVKILAIQKEKRNKRCLMEKL